MSIKKTYNYIDLFCGAGGFSLGFDRESFHNLFSIDIDPEFCSTYRHNFKTHTLLEKDISLLTEQEIWSILKQKNVSSVDVIIGGPPCQGFSIAGNIGRKFIDDERNHLFKEFARVLDIVRPNFFVMENVARLHTHNKGKTRMEIIRTFEELGYRVKTSILNSADYGVPQFRRRAIFIGSKVSDVEIYFPKINIGRYITISEAISRFPSLESGEISDIPNHEAMNHTSSMLKKMSYITDGGDRSQIPIELRPKSGDVRKYVKYNSQEPSFCITGDMRKVFHYAQNRALTVRELAAIQTFPDNFEFKGTRIGQQQQVGNSVPPLLAQALAKCIKKMIDEVQ